MPDRLFKEVVETHDHRVEVDGRVVTKDEALLAAIELLVASSGLSRDEVAERFLES